MSIKRGFPMQINQLRLAKTIAYYDPLLRRYARRLVHNDTVAAGIALQVIDCQYELNRLVPCKHLRKVLKADVLKWCFLSMQVQLFGNQPYLIDCPKHIKVTDKTDTCKPVLLN